MLYIEPNASHQSGSCYNYSIYLSVIVYIWGWRCEWLRTNYANGFGTATICHCVNNVCNSANNSRTCSLFLFHVPHTHTHTPTERASTEYLIVTSTADQFLNVLHSWLKYHNYNCTLFRLAYENICVMIIFIC